MEKSYSLKQEVYPITFCEGRRIALGKIFNRGERRFKK